MTYETVRSGLIHRKVLVGSSGHHGTVGGLEARDTVKALEEMLSVGSPRVPWKSSQRRRQ